VPCQQVNCRDARSMSCWQKFRSFPSNFFTQPFQYFQILNLVDSLSIWYKFIMNNSSNIKKVSNILFTLDLDHRNFFHLGELAVFHCEIYRFFSGAYWKTHVSLAVMTWPKMSSCLSKRSWQIVTLPCLCSSVSSFGTIFAHTSLMSRSSVKIAYLFLCRCSLALTGSRQFSCTIP